MWKRFWEVTSHRPSPEVSAPKKKVYPVYYSSLLHRSGFIRFELWFILATWPKWPIWICPKLPAFLFQAHTSIQNQRQTCTSILTHLLVTQNQVPTSSCICIWAGIGGTRPAGSLMWNSTFTTLSPDYIKLYVVHNTVRKVRYAVLHLIKSDIFSQPTQ